MDGERMLTVSQFAKLHDVNTRTLHYYDDIGLFSPTHRGENGYRYYGAEQSLEFEYIRMMRDLGLRTEEIKRYISHPGEERFASLLIRLQTEVRERKASLERLEGDLRRKASYMADCKAVSQDRVGVVHRPETRLLTMDTLPAGEGSLEFMRTVKRHWGIERLRTGIGSFISLDKVRAGRFE